MSDFHFLSAEDIADFREIVDKGEQRFKLELVFQLKRIADLLEQKEDW